MNKADVLRPHVEKLLREYLQVPESEPLVVDADGDVPIRWESALYYVRMLDRDPVLVRVFAFVLRNIESTPELLAALNDVNRDIVSARIFWHDNAVIAATELPAETLDLDDLGHACWAVGSLAAWADTDLQARFGGDKAFSDVGEQPASPDVEM